MSEEQEKKSEKPDIKSLVAVIPPAMALKRKEKKTLEKRIRLRWSDVEENEVKIHPNLAKELSIKDYAEVVVAGRHRFVAKVVLDDTIPVNEVYANEEMLREHGVADNTIATIRAAGLRDYEEYRAGSSEG